LPRSDPARREVCLELGRWSIGPKPNAGRRVERGKPGQAAGGRRRGRTGLDNEAMLAKAGMGSVENV